MIDLEMKKGVLSQDEMFNNLDKAMSGVDDSYRKLNSSKMVNKNKSVSIKKMAINKFFDILESVGVDPEDQQSLGKYMETAKTEHPEMYAILERAFTALLKEEGGTSEPEQETTAPLSPPVDPSTQPGPDLSQQLG